MSSAQSYPASRPPKIVARDTKGGRKLSYHLRVLQEPERARACGSGAKCKSFEIHSPPLGGLLTIPSVR